MLAGDARDGEWLQRIPETQSAVVVMEGVSMYLSPRALQGVMENLCAHFDRLALLMDCYTVLAARMSKYRNPIRDVGVTAVYGMDDPGVLQNYGLVFVQEHVMIPQQYIEELHGAEKCIFRKLYAGKFAERLYRLFEYRKA